MHRAARMFRTRGLAAVAMAGLLAMAAVPAAASDRRGATAHHHSTAAAKQHRWTWKSGVFTGDGGSGDRARDLQFGVWRGRAVKVATDYQDSATWTELARSFRIINNWGHQHKTQLSLSLPMVSQLDPKMERTAAGRNNHWYTVMGKNLVAAGLGHSIIRPGWEFNAPFYAWKVGSPAQAQVFVQAWRQIVRTLRAVPGAHFTFDWCVITGGKGLYAHPAQAYPGNKYVDYIGADVYDWNERRLNESATQRWHDIVHFGTGLAWQAHFAARHHKQLSYPEWALVADVVSPGMSGNDDPAFIRHMLHWFKTHDIAYEDYFNHDGVIDSVHFGLTTTNSFPKSRALYRRLWAKPS
jgi:hypothetical protein